MGGDYHKMMEFIKRSKLSYAMTATPVIYEEVVEQMWSTADFNSIDETISFTIKNNTYVVNADLVKSCFKIPDNTVRDLPNDEQIVSMLNDMHYSLPTTHLGKIVRKGLRREWSYLCDAFIKAFSGKISNFDAITSQILQMLYMFLTNTYYNFSGLLLLEIGEKLGDKESRNKNIYYVRFLMMLANHLVNDLIVSNKNAKLDSWVQDKRVFSDLTRMNLNSTVELHYLPIMEAGNEGKFHGYNSTPSSQPQISLPSATMAVGNDPQQPDQVAKPSKIKSKKPTSGVSQKTLIVKIKKNTPEGSVPGEGKGEGRGENQRSPKNKEGEEIENQPSHSAVSQKTAEVNKELNSSIVTSSQKDAIIENSPQPGTQQKRGRDTNSPAKAYVRKKVKTTKSTTAHTSQTKITDFVPVTSKSQVDVTPINVESQPLQVAPSLYVISPFHNLHKHNPPPPL